MADIIFHHYPQSPFSEKVRVAFGLKGLNWRSVEIPRLPPKPGLMPLTGGYRRTPVMQAGADIYCDTMCILRELERRYPEPSLLPARTAGLAWALASWIDAEIFGTAVRLVLGADPDALPPAFAADRGRLYLGEGFDLAAVHADLPHIAAQLRGKLGWLEARLDVNGPYFHGQAPGLIDVTAWHVMWFIRGRWSGGPPLIDAHPELVTWEARMGAIGHGTQTDLSSGQALDIARDAEPQTPEAADPGDPQGLAPGQQVTVAPDSGGGDPDVTGVVRAVDAQEIAILHDNDRVGTVCIHFPRIGYRVRAV